MATQTDQTNPKQPQDLEREALVALRTHRQQSGYVAWNNDDNERLRALDKKQKRQQAEQRALREGLRLYQQRRADVSQARFETAADVLPGIAATFSPAEGLKTSPAPWPDTAPDAEESPTPLLVRIDPELARVAAGMGRCGEYRVWAVARHFFGQPGWVERGQLFERLCSAGVIHTRRHFNRLLKDGSGLFWHLANGKVYLRGIVKVTQHLTEQAVQTHPALVETNVPGVRDVFIEVAGSIGDFKALVYAAWLTHREAPTIARETQCTLFNCSADTLRHWEARLGGQVEVVRNYAQTALNPKEDDQVVDYLPEHGYNYVTRRGQIRIRWQMPNTYRPRNLRQHAHKGQSRKVRFAAVQAAWYQPVEIWSSGITKIEKIPFDRSHRVPKRYFETDDQLRKFLKRRAKKDQAGITPQTPRYVFLGEDQYGHGIWELSLDGWVLTQADERLPVKAEKVWWKRWQERIEVLRRQVRAG